MGKIIYIDKNTQNGAFGILFAQDIQIIYTGLEVHTEDDEALLAEISRLCGAEFFLRKQEPEISLYCVPYLEIFASDKLGGWFAMAQDGTNGPVYHIGPDLSLRLVTEYFGELLSLMVLDPDWRQKCFAGGPWPRLPEDPAGRKALAEMLHLPLPEPEQVKAPGPLPRVFVSRAAAEREFPIQDIWTVLRYRRKPRFQIHPMMSPADREGRASVHYTAWQETYAGLMDPRVLERHTQEHCRRMAAQGGPNDTLVALDRANGDRVAGFVCFLPHARKIVSIPGAGEITALYVLREYQGLGLGRMLLDAALARLPCPKTVLFVLDGNAQAIGFYEHMGFRFTGHTIGEEMTELEMSLE